MKRLLITLFFILTLSALQAQEYMIVQPFVARDRTYFFIGQQLGSQRVFLVNNSYITSPRLIILSMNPLINDSSIALFNLSIVDLKYVNGTTNKTVIWQETRTIQLHWKYFATNEIDLPIYSGQHILIIQYLDIRITLKYKMDPLLIKTQQEITLMRFLATLYVAALIFVAAIAAITTSKKILDRVPIPPIGFQTLLLIAITTGIIAWVGYSSLQFMDPAMYTNINAFIVQQGIYIIAIAVYILLIFVNLHIFQREPKWILFLGIPKQEVDEETKHLKFIARPMQAMKIKGETIELFPTGIKEWFLWLIGIKKKIRIKGDPQWYATEKSDEYDRIFFLKPFEDIQMPKISIVVDLYPVMLIVGIFTLLLIALVIRSQLLALSAILTIITTILSILLFLRLRPRKIKETVEEGGSTKIVEKQVRPEPILEVKGKETEIELAPPAYAELYKHFLEFMDKKRLVDQARYYRHKYLELEAEFESRLMGEIRDLVKMIAKKMRAVREGEEKNEGRSGA